MTEDSIVIDATEAALEQMGDWLMAARRAEREAHIVASVAQENASGATRTREDIQRAYHLALEGAAKQRQQTESK